VTTVTLTITANRHDSMMMTVSVGSDQNVTRAAWVYVNGRWRNAAAAVEAVEAMLRLDTELKKRTGLKRRPRRGR
jgi:hypothetical protein